MTSAPAIGFEYRPSRWLWRIPALMATLALGAVALCGLPLSLKLLLMLLVLLLSWHKLRQLARSDVVAVGLASDGSWRLRMRSGDDVPATLASFRMLGQWVWLRWSLGERGGQVALLATDNSDADIRRRLRMRLATLKADEAVPRI